jgi:hypothetical protein
LAWWTRKVRGRYQVRAWEPATKRSVLASGQVAEAFVELGFHVALQRSHRLISHLFGQLDAYLDHPTQRRALRQMRIHGLWAAGSPLVQLI